MSESNPTANRNGSPPRFTNDSRVLRAIGKITEDPSAQASIMRACEQADHLRQVWNEKIEAERAICSAGGRLDRLDKALLLLNDFIKEIVDNKSAGMLDAQVIYDSHSVATMKRGLYLLSNCIAGRRRIAKETLLRLGATRETGTSRSRSSKAKTSGITRKSRTRGSPAETAAIGWLAEGIRRACGRPHLDASLDLFAIIVGHEITADRINEAMRTRRERSWHAY
jgi:hypothetical protein